MFNAAGNNVNNHAVTDRRLQVLRQYLGRYILLVIASYLSLLIIFDLYLDHDGATVYGLLGSFYTYDMVYGQIVIPPLAGLTAILIFGSRAAGLTVHMVFMFLCSPLANFYGATGIDTMVETYLDNLGDLPLPGLWREENVGKDAFILWMYGFVIHPVMLWPTSPKGGARVSFLFHYAIATLFTWGMYGSLILDRF